MRWVARWGAVVVVSAVVFVGVWWACQGLTGLDEGAALGIAGAVLAVFLVAAGWWAARERPGDDERPTAAGQRLVQKARAGRDVNMAGRDQTVINYRRPGEQD